MITIQRASAGSGKTFALTRTFLINYLSVPETPADGGQPRRRLCTEFELRDSLRHILAVTFTNKATAEMKQRIVSKLAALAAAPVTKPDPADHPDYREPDYLTDFMKEFGVSRAKIIQTCRVALKWLLYGFSDFNVSTIDSFFQSILRTFAYETDLNDSYQLELDSKLITGLGVDATLEDAIDSRGRGKGAVVEWLKRLMNEGVRKGSVWNPFQKRLSGGIYSNLIRNSSRMEKEGFKERQEKLKEYFAVNSSFEDDMDRLDEVMKQQVKDAYDRMGKAALEFAALFDKNGIPLTDGNGATHLPGRIAKATSGEFLIKLKDVFKLGVSRDAPGVFYASKAKKSLSKHPDAPLMQAVWEEFVAGWCDWKEALEDKTLMTWLEIERLIPYLPLLMEVDSNVQRYLNDTNTMQIGDTNTILRRIIGDDQAPFIYERLGTRVDHYLIDEFQDTSRLQWENIRPLLVESNSKPSDNLIIGDAKQSIYRFRNADPSLITTVVPAEFPDHRAAGSSVMQNTNWRSMQNVVEFNNFIFRCLSRVLSHDILEEKTQGLALLYSNVIQHAHNQHVDKDGRPANPAGYVELNFYTDKALKRYLAAKGEENDGEEAYDAGDGRNSPLAFSPGEVVEQLLKRGYRQNDIAFITLTNAEGNEIVRRLIEYNNDPGRGCEKLEVISDQSLLLSGSDSVNAIVAGLRTIAQGLTVEKRTGEEARARGVADVAKLTTRFEYEAARHPEMPTEDVIRKILEGESLDNYLSDMLSQMQSVALPSLVEVLIGQFAAGRDGHNPETSYLAAFQDTVMAYCDSHPADIASFLDWWDRKKDTLCIASPEGRNAISVLTVHKSKGLEYRCVIIPQLGRNFAPSDKSNAKVEWQWIDKEVILKRDPSWPGAELLPPCVPVELTARLSDTLFNPEWEDFRRTVAMDALNLCYVAFTRAVCELYVWMPLPTQRNSEEIDTDKHTAATEIWKICEDQDEQLKEAAQDLENEGERFSPNAADDLPKEPLVRRQAAVPDDVAATYTLGSPLTPEEIAELNAKEEKKKQEEPQPVVEELTDYKVNTESSTLRYRESSAKSPAADDDDEEDMDPRSEGSMLHAIMEHVGVTEDVAVAVRDLKARGYVSDEKADEYGELISGAVRSVEARGWFDPANTVITERSILCPHQFKQRPDRIVVTPGRQAIVIDYKFGEEKKGKKYHDQVAGYVKALQATGLFSGVKGYLWYVRLGEVEEIR